MEFIIDAALLGAVAPFMAKGDVRYYLNGACVQLGPEGTTAIATDGYTCLACRDLAAKHEGEEREVIIPRDVVLAALKGAKGRTLMRVTVTPAHQELGEALGMIRMDGRDRIPFAPIDARFPKWRNVFNAGHELSGAEPAVNPEFLARFAKSAEALHRLKASDYPPSVRMVGNGVDYALTAKFGHLRPGFVCGGVVMSLRNCEPTERTGFVSELVA